MPVTWAPGPGHRPGGGLVVDIQVAHVLLLDPGEGAIGQHGSDTFVQQLPELGVVLAHAHGDIQRQGRVLDCRAALEAGAFRLGQEVELGFELVGDGGVEAAIHQVGVVLVLGLVGLDLGPQRRQLGAGVGFLQRALQHADRLALERLRRLAEIRALAHDHRGRAEEQAVAEIDLFLPRRGHGHGRHDGVELARAQGGDHAVELVVHPGALDFQLGADRIAQLDIETLQAAVGSDGLEGRVFGEDAEADFLPFLGLGRAGAEGQEDDAEEFAQ